MLKTENTGILEAIRQVKIMNLTKAMRARYEAHLKEVRDRYAQDAYVRNEGIAICAGQRSVMRYSSASRR